MNNEDRIDTDRVFNAAKAIIDGRNWHTQKSEIMVTTEHAVATVLLALFGDPRRAAGMLNEGLVQGVEERLMLAGKVRAARGNTDG